MPLPSFFAPWMAEQRWFAGKRRSAKLEIIGGFTLGDLSTVRCRVHLVLDHADPPALYQIPITERTEPLAGLEPHLIGTGDGLWVYDGPHDPVFAAALLRLMLDEGVARADDGGGRVAAFGHSDLADDLRIHSSRVLSGEQSNTSIIVQTTDADGNPAPPVICKIFRALHDGENPDVVLTGALGAAGSAVVPRSIAHLTGRWPDVGKLDGMATGHLAFAQEFLPEAEDAWRVAIAAVEAGTDFAEEAYALGETTAQMHRALANALPSRATTPSDIALVVANMRGRFDLAARELPQLERYEGRLDAIYTAAHSSQWPALQRVHGDFHLGQVVAAAGRGWIVLDFEGEPLRPMRERSAPDSPLRDVAGMLRSFDYVAGSFALSHPGRSAAAWASSARGAFLAGYDAGTGRDLLEHRTLLDAFEVDKAVYEAVYEARNRPAWLPIPLGALERLLG